jgi:glycosyltransferase involved in cell wall biosynthesis
MKIALIHGRVNYYGGLETRLFSYIDYFTQQGHEVTVVAYKVDMSIQLPEKAKVVKLKIRWVPRQLRKGVFNFAVQRFMKKNHFDFSLSLARTSCQKAVLAPGNHLGYVKALGKKQLAFKDRQQIRLDRKAFEHSKIIYACSLMIKDEIRDLYHIDPNKVHVLYPPLDTSKYNRQLKGDKEQLRDFFGIPKHQTAFAFASVGHKRKGLELLIKVFGKLDPDKFGLYIVGKPKVSSSLKNVTYLGFEKNPGRLYTAVDYLIHPAIYEPYGQVVAEALACGTPVILSENVGAKEILKNKEGIVVPSFEPEKWVSVLKNINQSGLLVDEGFIDSIGLSIKDHLEKMMSLWRNQEG